MNHVIREALWDLRENPGPSALSFVALFVAVLAIVGIQVTAAIGHDVLVAKAEQLNGRAATVSVSLPSMTWTPELLAERRTAIRAAPTRAEHWALTIESRVAGAIGSDDEDGAAVPCQLTLVEGDLAAVRRLPVLAGGWAASGLPGGVVLNRQAAEAFGPVGTMLQVRFDDRHPRVPQRVVGVVADGGTDAMAYASLRSAITLVPSAVSEATGQLLVHSPAGEQAAAAAASAAANRLNLDPSEAAPQRVDGVGQLEGQLQLLVLAFLVVSLIALLVAVIGMVNIGLAGVGQRSYELTIRRALGATSGRVMTLIAATTLLVGALASLTSLGVAGLVVRFVVPHLLDPADALEAPEFPWPAAGVGLATGLAASALAAVLPALRTRRFELAAVLRS